MTGTPLVVDIKGNALDDGPGIRSVVFFKGCPLSCAWCHNPEGLDGEAELSWDRDACVDAGDCLEACPEGALQAGREPFVDRDRCTRCFTCVEACPSGALSRVGRPWEVDELVRRLLRDRPFWERSGGGVTFSGGEPTASMGLLGPLACRLKTEGVHTLLQTCGAFVRDRFEREVLPFIDLVWFDLKLADPAAHREHCGAGNRTILDNFAWLQRRAPELLPRVPLVPGLTDSDENLDALAELLVTHGASRVALVPCNPTWAGKARKLGREPGHLGRWLTPDELARRAARFERRGLEVVGSG